MKKILLVEDNLIIRENVGEILELRGFKAILSANGKEGLYKAHTEEPDLIICDIDMPIMNGYELLRFIKRHETLSQVPIILLSVRCNDEEKKHGIQMGADGYLSKPFDVGELYEAIDKFLPATRRAVV